MKFDYTYLIDRILEDQSSMDISALRDTFGYVNDDAVIRFCEHFDLGDGLVELMVIDDVDIQQLLSLCEDARRVHEEESAMEDRIIRETMYA